MSEQAEALAVEDLPQIEEEFEEVETPEIEDELETEEPEGQPEVEYEVIEYEGKEYELPVELKDAVLRQGDYTKKTQEVAEQRKALETQTEQFQRAVSTHQENLQEYAQLQMVGQQLQQYQNVDWGKMAQDDPATAQQHQFKYMQLRDQFTQLDTHLKTKHQQAIHEAQENLNKQVEQGKTVLARDIKGWNDGVDDQLTQYCLDQGFTEEEVQRIKNPVQPLSVKLIHKAFLYDKLQANAKKKPQADVKPVRSVRGKAKTQKDPDKMSSDEWLRWRNKQIKSR